MKCLVCVLGLGLALTGGANAANMLRNPSFEDEAPSSSHRAAHWFMNEPDINGDAFGSASREDWRSYDGLYIMALRGTWANAGNYGGCWQQAAGEAGTTYKAAAWCWADSEWEAAKQELKLEFWTADFTELLLTQATPLPQIGTEWKKVEVEATAPDRTAYVRLVVNVEGAGYYGALQVDHLYLSERSVFEEPEAHPVDLIIDIVE
jgi:hypothetical protein